MRKKNKMNPSNTRGDVCKVVGELASKPIAPQDAAMMQKAENMILGQTQKGGPASVMQAAATRNERAGVVGHKDFTDVTGDRGATVSETDVPGSRIIIESVAGQVRNRNTLTYFLCYSLCFTN